MGINLWKFGKAIHFNNLKKNHIPRIHKYSIQIQIFSFLLLKFWDGMDVTQILLLPWFSAKNKKVH